MTTQTLVKKLNKEVEALREEVHEMKKILFAPAKDPEGEYKKSFVKKMISRSQSQGPFYHFTDKESFLNHVRSAK